MASPTTHHDEHRITVAAPVDTVYEVVSDVRRWPYIFPPTVHAEQVESTGNSELIRLWALANGEVKNWTSRRELDPVRRRVSFRQEVSQPPVSAMLGEWVLTATGPASTEVLLTHDYQAIDDAAGNIAWIRAAVDANSRSELEKLRVAAEQADPGLVLSFSDSVLVRGTRHDVYEFLADAARWPRRLPHVARLELTEDVPGIQTMTMDTRGANDSVHTTSSIRVCFPEERIVYKQTETPALMAAHTGVWTLAGVDGAITATSAHTVVVRAEAIPPVLGADATVASARELIEQSLHANSTTTLKHALAYAEERHRG